LRTADGWDRGETSDACIETKARFVRFDRLKLRFWC
jgi:hypothetical protein